ncbi:prephenate dehydrogenase [Helicobacter baculiformis]|uniref:Prephenate dehydrogenase n=1 Tax=Helicobacter baculiformis TaxID=427351 RepID=A0ABV7ZMW4_9HELI|nr:prephenate dehydrogenase [Helicobacter baculiformis]
MRAGIVGLGLMGGSMGLALQEVRAQLGIKSLVGFDHNVLHAQMALSLGLVEECVELEQIQECDLIILATPVEGIIQILAHIQPAPTSTIIELGGAKVQMMCAIPKAIRAQVVASHPMCGTEFYGPKAALKDLYKHKIVVLVDGEYSGISHLQRAKEVFSAIGMQMVKMGAQAHDQHVAFVSHLPHAISYALANVVLAQESPQNILSLAAGGFKDMSRLSKSSPQMWRGIFEQNQTRLLEALELFIAEMQRTKAMLETQEWDKLCAWMQRANCLQEFM